MRISFRRGVWLGLLFIALMPARIFPQARRTTPAVPKIDVENYALDVTLTPAEHEMQASARIRFKALEKTDMVMFEISENLSVQKVLDAEGVEVLFAQDEVGPGILSLHFAKTMEAGESATVTVEYEGGFDRDRFSRNYVRDETTAYVGPEDGYLLYAAKWFPLNNFLVDRATATVEVTVPLGLSVIGPGEQLPVVTKGITEKFGWTASQPILPNSIIVGQFFERQVNVGLIEFNCFATEENLEAMQKMAQPLARIIEFYHKTFSAAPAAKSYRLVEVDERLANHYGTLDTVYLTRRELSGAQPPVRDLARRVAYQWWMEGPGIASRDDLWLVDGMAYYSAALYIGQTDGAEAFKEELNNLAVLALKFESKSPIRNGFGLGYKSEAYESVVGGKGAWVLNMLRPMVGEVKFTELLQRYFAAQAGKGGSTAAFRAMAESLFGADLKWFFGQWIETIGVPNIQSDFIILRTIDGFKVSGNVTQERDLFRMPLDIDVIAVTGTQGGTIDLQGKSTPFDIETTTMPQRVVLDPGGKILRDSPELQIAVQLSLGMDLKEKNSFVEAIRAFENALKRNPRNSLAHYRMAEVFFEQSNLSAAADSFRNALNGDKKPGWTEVWSYIYLGKIFDILDQRQRAMAEYNKALNTKDDTFGAQAEAKKWLETPYTKEATTMDIKQPA